MNQDEKDALLGELLRELEADARDAMDMLAEPARREDISAVRSRRGERYREIGEALRAAGGPALMSDMIRNVRRANGSWAERLEKAWKALGYVPVSRLP